MSTRAVNTTAIPGRSGRGLGLAAAALAVVIAAGVVFAVNQGNETTQSAQQASESFSVIGGDAQALERLSTQSSGGSHPAENIEAFRIRQAAANAPHPADNIEAWRIRQQAGSSTGHPAENIEAYKMQLAGQLGAASVVVEPVDPRLKYEFEGGTPVTETRPYESTSGNPLE